MSFLNTAATTIGAGLNSIQPGGYYAVNGSTPIQFGGAVQVGMNPPMTDDPDTWNDTEVLKMFKWFMKMYHEEDIKGFKAMRDIERSVERAEREEQERQQLEVQMQLMQQQAQYLRQSLDQLAIREEPTKESWWRKLWYKI